MCVLLGLDTQSALLQLRQQFAVAVAGGVGLAGLGRSGVALTAVVVQHNSLLDIERAVLSESAERCSGLQQLGKERQPSV